ncbi:MAG: anaerobic ribonucleoside-triphosphate reductase, partial [Lachnospiraceae bacterium]|nr:anaerobic ribonucleoside-triphosphate reductase [Lachnospiraceae bacterium]
SVQRDYMAGEWSRYYTGRYLLPDDIVQAHREGIIHFHDSDYFAQHMHNCDLVNLDDMLQNGTCISGTHIDKPHSFATACTVASQIVAQVASSQYGGQTITMSHLAPFVDISRKKIYTRLKKELADAQVELPEDKIKILVEEELSKEVESGCQTIQYQLITLQSTNGQAPFVTVFLYLNEVPEGQIRDDLALVIETVLKQRILGVKDKTGVYITPAFPKLIYVLQEDNIKEGTPYFYLTELAAKCTAKRMVPDYISEKKMKELKGDVYPCMGCRSFLTPDRFTDNGYGNPAHAGNYDAGKHKYYGRFNQGVVTINLVDVACSSGKNEEKFWEILDERLNLCHRALRLRHERLLGTPSDVAPILWQDGALARLAPGETIDKLLYGGYSTISLGYAGLAECVYYMKGISHTSEEGEDFGLRVMQALNDACAKWKREENIDYSVYGTPLESTTYKFAKCLQKRFGIIEHVTDRNYITNSYHIHVTEEIDAFSKLTKEAEFQQLSPGGAISYVEVPNMQDNIPAVIAVMQHIYDTILYAELNTKSDYCDECGFDGEIKIIKDETGKLVWECPKCGNRDQAKMHVARRTCGYIGTQYWNQGRTAEIADRVLHL